MKKTLLYILSALLILLSIVFFTRKKDKPVEILASSDTTASVNPSFNTLSATAVFFTDMEDPDPSQWLGEKNSEKHFSGNFSNKLSDHSEYGVTFFKKASELPDWKKIRQVKISYRVFSDLPLDKGSFVVAVKGNSDTLIDYFQESIPSKGKEWTIGGCTIDVDPRNWNDSSVIKVYPWSAGKETFFIDDIKLVFLSETEQAAGIVLGPQQNFFYDFEPTKGQVPVPNLSTEKAHSGNHSLILDGADTYSETVTKKFSDVANDTIKFISTSVWVYPELNNAIVNLVVSIEKPDGTSISWQSKATDNMNLEKNEWHKINFRADLRQLKTSPEDLIKIYVWNKKEGIVFVDDLEIVYGDIPNPIGQSPGAVMDMYGVPVSNPGRNIPPFPIKTLAAVPGKSNGSMFLINNNGSVKGKLSPDQIILAGNFSGTKNICCQLLIANGNQWSVFGYCSNEKSFNTLLETSEGPDANGKIVLPGLFDDKQSEQVLVIDTIGEFKARLVSFNGLTNSCSKTQGSFTVRDIRLQIPDDAQVIRSAIVTGNFSGDARNELVFFNTNGNFFIATIKESSLTIIKSGSISGGKIRSAQPVKIGKQYDNLILFKSNNKQLDYCMMEFDLTLNNITTREWKDKSFLQHFGPRSQFFSGHFSSEQYNQLFYLNQDWRFDLKEVKIDKHGLMVESQLDFIQPSGERNPKFYEFTKVLSGNFFDDQQDIFLVVMRNCSDEKFNGISCKNFEEIPGRPSGYQFYQIKKAE